MIDPPEEVMTRAAQIAKAQERDVFVDLQTHEICDEAPVSHGFWTISPSGNRAVTQPPPPSSNFRIKTLTAYLAVDPDDNSEGIMGTKTPEGVMPLIGADEDRVLSYRKIAEEAARELGREVRVARFSVREDVDVIKP